MLQSTVYESGTNRLVTRHASKQSLDDKYSTLRANFFVRSKAMLSTEIYSGHDLY